MFIKDDVEHYEIGGNKPCNRVEVHQKSLPMVKPPSDKSSEVESAFKSGNVIIEAFAGCGKTYTLLELANS